MKMISLVLICLAALKVDASEYHCSSVGQRLVSNLSYKLRVNIDRKVASVFNGFYWSTLDQVEFRLNRIEPVFKFTGVDTFKSTELYLVFNELQGTAELFTNQQSLKFQCFND